MSEQDYKFSPIFKELSKEYPNVAPEAIETAVQFKIVAAKVQMDREELFNRFGLTSGRFHLLMILKGEETHALSPSELAKRTNVTRATMTQFVDALEKEEYVQRVDDPKDRRGMLVQLTDKGVAKLREILPSYFERLTNFTRALNKEERKTFLHLMEKIQAGNSFE